MKIKIKDILSELKKNDMKNINKYCKALENYDSKIEYCNEKQIRLNYLSRILNKFIKRKYPKLPMYIKKRENFSNEELKYSDARIRFNVRINMINTKIKFYEKKLIKPTDYRIKWNGTEKQLKTLYDGLIKYNVIDEIKKEDFFRNFKLQDSDSENIDTTIIKIKSESSLLLCILFNLRYRHEVIFDKGYHFLEKITTKKKFLIDNKNIWKNIEHIFLNNENNKLKNVCSSAHSASPASTNKDNVLAVLRPLYK